MEGKFFFPYLTQATFMFFLLLNKPCTLL
uniref:Uncharacterized protein n=1 Tax=Rhizophora mucronata TaxID=61149 RepID=A0A2P2NTC0_RHIMU